MPWTAKDAEKHTSKADTPKKREVWSKVANEARKKAMSDGKSEEEADASAVRIANHAVANMKEEAVQRLREYVDNRGATLRVDREKGIIPGVKILGFSSRNKTEYPPAVVAKAVSLYEGAPSYVGHTKEGENPAYTAKLGVHRNVRAEKDGLYADFHFNPQHHLAEQLCWDAENDPAHVGFSHDIRAKFSRKNGVKVVEDILRVDSIDLVTRPATTGGLWEDEHELLEQDPELARFAETWLCAADTVRAAIFQVGPNLETKKARVAEAIETWQEEVGGTDTPRKEATMEYADLTVDALKEHRADLVAVLTGTDEHTKLTEEVKATKDALKAAQDTIAARDATIAASNAEKAEAVKALAIQEELKAAKLEATPVFMEVLKAAPDAAARKRLIEDRQTIVNSRAITTGAPFNTQASASRDSLSAYEKK